MEPDSCASALDRLVLAETITSAAATDTDNPVNHTCGEVLEDQPQGSMELRPDPEMRMKLAQSLQPMSHR